MEKPQNVLSTLYQGWYLHREKETLSLTLCMENFGLRLILCSKSGHQYGAPPALSRFHRGIFFFS